MIFRFFQEGFEEGQAESTKKSYLEGKEFGIQTGFQKFIFIGYLESLIGLIKLSEVDDQLSSHLNQLSELLSKIKIDNEYGSVISNEKLLVKIRNKVRIITNLLPSKKVLNLQSIDQLILKINGLEVITEPSVANLNDESMW